MSLKPYFVFFLAFFLLFGQAKAQNISTPYSRFGIGLVQDNWNVRNNGMAGTFAARTFENDINFQNPAGLAGIKNTVLSVSAIINSLRLSSANQEQVSLGGSLNSFAYAFPVSKKWNLSMGLLPLSTMSYEFSDTKVLNDSIQFTYNYSGFGSLNKFFVGNGFKITPDLYAGFNLSYVFGNLNNQRKVLMPSGFNGMNSSFLKTIYVGDVVLDFGVQYHKKLSDARILSIGYAGNLKSGLATSQTELVEAFVFSGNREFVTDTIKNETLRSNGITLPDNHKIGIQYASKKMALALDLGYSRWSSYTNQYDAYRLNDVLSLSVGAEYTPDAKSINNYLETMTYRAGFRTQNSTLSFGGIDFTENTISAGLTLPLPRVRSHINLSLAYKTRGTTENNLLKEEYLIGTLGLILNDTWFVRRKYD
jgi:tetrahydromethanopterin S-methyltransferase subunit F